MKTIFLFRIASPRTAIVLAITLIFSASPQIQAQPNPERPGREGRQLQRPQQGVPADGQGRLRGAPGLPLMEHVLTEDQRYSLRQTMESQRETMRAQQEKIRAARKAMMTAAFADDYNEAAVRAKALEVAKLEAELTVQRLKAVAEVQPALSKEQLKKILNPPPAQMAPGGDGQRPNRRMNRPPGGDLPPPRRDPQ